MSEITKNEIIIKRTYKGSLVLIFILFTVLLIKIMASPVSALEPDGDIITKKDTASIATITDSREVDRTVNNENNKPEKNIINDLTVNKNLININDASVKELTVLKGIGKVTAERIIEYRRLKGPFKRSEDLMKIKGIGKKRYEVLKKNIILK